MIIFTYLKAFQLTPEYLLKLNVHEIYMYQEHNILDI